MKHLTLGAALAAAYLATSMVASAQTPPYSKGPVWDCAQIRTKDGHGEEYMKWVATQWKAQEEALIKGGYAIGYKVLGTVDARAGEPNIMLCTEYKDMAAFDVPNAKIAAFMAKQYGSAEKANQEEVARGSMRKVMGNVMMRQIDLK